MFALGFPDLHERFIDGNACEPGTEQAFAAKALDALKYSQKRILDYFLSILVVFGNPQSHTPERLPIAPYQVSESRLVSGSEAGNQRCISVIGSALRRDLIQSLMPVRVAGPCQRIVCYHLF